MEVGDLVTQLAALAGFGALVAALVNVGKSTGIVKDGQAPLYSTGLNLLGLVGLFALRVFAPQQDVGQIDQTAASIATVLTSVFGLVVQLGGAKAAHEVLKGLPVVGKSYSG